jgi:hypothetical protein
LFYVKRAGGSHWIGAWVGLRTGPDIEVSGTISIPFPETEPLSFSPKLVLKFWTCLLKPDVIMNCGLRSMRLGCEEMFWVTIKPRYSDTEIEVYLGH